MPNPQSICRISGTGTIKSFLCGVQAREILAEAAPADSANLR